MVKSMTDVKKELKRKSKGKFKSTSLKSLTNNDTTLLQSIRSHTKALNTNNVTRTKAYLNFYINYPEIHWAFLGHMVSRNGGWNMTDLKGDLQAKLVSKDDKNAFFSFLERGNWLIFQDIYPQLLIYAKSIQTNTNLFHLLPHLNISTFMETMWNYYWNSNDSYSLTIALIINEQHYLDKRVIQNKHYSHVVLDTLGFKLYDFFRFNHILFPIYDGEWNTTSLIGETSTHFSSLHERIMLGKKLYSILFNKEDTLKKAFLWAKDHLHTGSRKDYWPHLFNNVKDGELRGLYKRRIDHCNIISGAQRIYSPPLKYAWKNVVHIKAEEEDWFKDWRIIRYITGEDVNVDGDIYNSYCLTLEEIELAIVAKSILPWEDLSRCNRP